MRCVRSVRESVQCYRNAKIRSLEHILCVKETPYYNFSCISLVKEIVVQEFLSRTSFFVLK